MTEGWTNFVPEDVEAVMLRGAKSWSEPIPIHKDSRSSARGPHCDLLIIDDPQPPVPVRYLDHLVGECTEIVYDEDGIHATMLINGVPAATIRNASGPITTADLSQVRPAHWPKPPTRWTPPAAPAEPFLNRRDRRRPPKENRRGHDR